MSLKYYYKKISFVCEAISLLRIFFVMRVCAVQLEVDFQANVTDLGYRNLKFRVLDSDDIFNKSSAFCHEHKIKETECPQLLFNAAQNLKFQLLGMCNLSTDQCIETHIISEMDLSANEWRWVSAQNEITSGKVQYLGQYATHYRGYVGMIDQEGNAGATFFNILIDFGLKNYHKILDVGCGSLRVGKLLIPFMNRNKYFCLEPNSWLYLASIQYELGKDILHLKTPTFVKNAKFSIPPEYGKMDYIFAHSIFSHTGPDLLDEALQKLSLLMHESTILLATFFVEGISTNKFLAHDSGFTFPCLPQNSERAKGWIYGDDAYCVSYDERFLEIIFEKYGLILKRIREHEPYVQTWYAISKSSLVLEK